MQYDIFISYKRLGTSSAIAAYLYDLLTKKGYNVFFDRKEIRQGKFNEQLLTHIEKAQDIIILLEAESLNSCFNGIAGSYKSDWFCMEIMHALSKQKRIIPLLLDDFKMPCIQDLPSDLKPLALENAIPFDASDIEDFYKKYLIDQGYLQSKPKNLYLSQSNGEGVADFLFYSEGNCDLFEFGNLIGSIDQNIDERHPYIYTVKRAGEHRFDFRNNDTCEEQRLTVAIDKDTQKYVPIQWKLTKNLWDLSKEEIEQEKDSKILYFWGVGLFEGTTRHEPDIEKAFICLEKAATLWNIDARNYIIENVGTVNSKPLSNCVRVSWFTKAAEYGSAQAQHNVGLLYLYGTGVERNGNTAMKYFIQAAKQNYLDSIYQIGWMYTEGIGIKRNYTKGREWYNRAITNGHIISMCCMGEIYQYGRGVRKDLSRAIQCYSQASELGSIQADFLIGTVYYGNGALHDYKKAFEYFYNISEKNSSEFQVAIAKSFVSVMYKRGIGVDMDEEKSSKLTEEVAEMAKTYKRMGNFYNSLAWQYYLLEEYDEALPFSLKSVEIHKEPAYLDTLGAIYRGMKEYEKALDAYEECLSLGKKSALQDIEAIKRITHSPNVPLR